MIKVVKITKHGKNSEAVKLADKMIVCPECLIVGYHLDGPSSAIFNLLNALYNESFTIQCTRCGCIFIVEVK